MKHTPARLIFHGMIRGAWRSAAMLTIALAGPVASAHAQAPPPLSLRAVLDSVTARYPLVLAAQARIRAARGSRVTAGAFGNPILGYQVGYNVDNALVTGGSPPRVLDREADWTLALPLEPLYQRGPRVRRADAEVRAATDDAQAARQRAALDATRAYYRTALAEVGVATARDLLVWLDSLVAYNQSRAAAGVAAGADLIRTEVERDRAAADATVQEAELAQARADLAAFVGTSSAAAPLLRVAIYEHPLALPPELTPAIRSAPTADVTGGVELQTQALARRADVRAARERVVAASANVSSERTLVLRQLGVTLGTRQTVGTTSLVAGLSLPIPLFDLNRGEIARANAERDAAAYELAAEERSVNAQVSGAYEAARLLTERATAMAGGARGFLARANEARRITLAAYREGAVPLLQVLDAARAWDAARLTYYQTLFAQHQGVLALAFAEGHDLLATLPTLTQPITPNQ